MNAGKSVKTLAFRHFLFSAICSMWMPEICALFAGYSGHQSEKHKIKVPKFLKQNSRKKQNSFIVHHGTLQKFNRFIYA
jgi:hypothetical protein